LIFFIKNIHFWIKFKVDFHRSTSCKPLPEDLFGLVDDKTEKSSVSNKS
jgi:hypothetical protein